MEKLKKTQSKVNTEVADYLACPFNGKAKAPVRAHLPALYRAMGKGRLCCATRHYAGTA